MADEVENTTEEQTPPDTQQTEVTQQATETQATEQPSGYTISDVSTFADLGFKDVAAPEEGFNRLTEAYKQTARERDELLQRQRELEQFAAIGREVATRGYQPLQQAPQKPEAPQKPTLWSVPTFDRETTQRYLEFTVDENGQQVRRWKDNTPAPIRQQAEEYEAAVTNWQDLVLYHPEKLEERILQLVDARAQELVAAKHSQLTEEQQRQQTIDSFVSENSAWLFESDPVTKQVKYDFHGNAVYSAEGQKFLNYMAQVEKMGVTDQANQLVLAKSMYDATRVSTGQATAQALQTAQAAVADQRAKLRGRVANGGKTTPVQGTVHSQARDPAVKRRSFGETLVAGLKEDGQL